jgi:hypothetical protein
MAWTFYNSSGEAMIIDGGVQNPTVANVDLSSYLLVGNGGSTGIAISSAGEVTMALQPSILVKNHAQSTNVTGAGDPHTLEFFTEIYDQGDDFNNSTDTFTAPVTGKYLVCVTAELAQITTATDVVELHVVASNQTIEVLRQYTANNFPFEGQIVSGSIVVDMDGDTDTITVTVEVTGESLDTVDVTANSYLSISLLH